MENFRTATPQRILVVDDNVDSALTLSFTLRAMGHETLVSHDGRAAVDAAQAFRPTLVLLDIGLPGMNGYMVAKHLRTMPAIKEVVLVALTDYGEEHDRRRSHEAGFDRYFVKPLNFPALQKLIETLPSAVEAF